jgi:hypothetical protein
MAISWNRIDEGQSLSAGSVQSRLDDVRDEINDLDETAIQRRSLHRDHLPSSVLAVGTKAFSPAANHNYSDSSEAYIGYGTTAGWRVINDLGSAGTGVALEAVLSTPVDLGDPDVRGILVLLNVEVVNIEETIVGTNSVEYYCHIGIQARRTSGFYLPIARAERYVDAELSNETPVEQASVFKDVAIRSLVVLSDLGLGIPTTIDRIRGVVSVTNATGLYAARNVRVALKRCNITAIGLRAGTL